MLCKSYRRNFPCNNKKLEPNLLFGGFRDSWETDGNQGQLDKRVLREN